GGDGRGDGLGEGGREVGGAAGDGPPLAPRVEAVRRHARRVQPLAEAEGEVAEEEVAFGGGAVAREAPGDGGGVEGGEGAGGERLGVEAVGGGVREEPEEGVAGGAVGPGGGVGARGVERRHGLVERYALAAEEGVGAGREAGPGRPGDARPARPRTRLWTAERRASAQAQQQAEEGDGGDVIAAAAVGHKPGRCLIPGPERGAQCRAEPLRSQYLTEPPSGRFAPSSDAGSSRLGRLIPGRPEGE